MKTIKDHHEAIHTLQALHDFITKQEHVQYLYESSGDETEHELSTLQVQFVHLQETNQHLKSENLQLGVQVDTMESELETQDDTIEALERQLKHELGLRIKMQEMLGNQDRELTQAKVKIDSMIRSAFKQHDTIEQLSLELEYAEQGLAEREAELDSVDQLYFEYRTKIVALQHQLAEAQDGTISSGLIFELEGLRETVYQLGCELGKLQQQAKLNQFLKA